MTNSTDQEREAFAREGRYIVIKRSDLIAADKEGRVSHEIFDSLEAVAGIVPRRECLVIEGDWSEYEKAWAMIEARMTGKQPASVAVPDVDWVMHLLADRWPESAERVEVELFAEWLREVLAADPHPVSESAEDRFEHYLQNAIDNAPDPLRRLGEYLSHVIDEDEWATAERMLNGAIVAASAHPVSGEQKPERCQYQRGTIECRGDGYLWDADNDGYDPNDHSMPCPCCNPVGYLDQAKEEAESTVDFSTMGNYGTGQDIWLWAVERVRHECPAGVDAALAKIGPVRALVPSENGEDSEERLHNAPPAAQDVAGLVEALTEIRAMTNADDTENYRCDDREGCLDSVFSTSDKALAAHRAQQGDK